MKAGLIGSFLITAIFVSTLTAQPGRHGWEGPKPASLGFFPTANHSHRGFFPRHLPPVDFFFSGHSLFHGPPVFGHELADPGGFHYGFPAHLPAYWRGMGPPVFVFGPYGYGGAIGPASHSGGRLFVSDWKDRNPSRGSRAEDWPAPSQAGSILLKKAMSEDEVMRLLGSPIQRVRLGNREVWKYSSYSLLLESGKLKEIR